MTTSGLLPAAPNQSSYRLLWLHWAEESERKIPSFHSELVNFNCDSLNADIEATAGLRRLQGHGRGSGRYLLNGVEPNANPR